MKTKKFLKMLALVVLTFAVSCSFDNDPYYPPDGGGNGGTNPPKKDIEEVQWNYSVDFLYGNPLGPRTYHMIAFKLPKQEALLNIQNKEELSKIDGATREKLLKDNMYLNIDAITNYGDTLSVDTEGFEVFFSDVKDRNDDLIYIISIREYGGQTPSDPTAGGSGAPAVDVVKVRAKEGYWISQKTGDEILFAENPDPEMSYR